MEYQNKNDNGAFISSKLDDYLLDPFEFRIYARIVRRAGINGCYESINNMATACMMSLAKARKSLHSLQEMKLITISDRSDKGLTNLCTVNSFSDWKEKRDINSIKSEKKEDYIKKNKGLTRSEIARASKKIKDPLPDTIAPPLPYLVDPPTKYGSTPLPNMVDKGTPVKESTQGSPENIECFANNQSPKEPDVIQTVGAANESKQHQDMSEVQEVKYISLNEVLDPNINPPSAAPLNNSQQEENNEASASELVVVTPVIPISDPYDLTHLGIEGMPEVVKKGLEEATKAKDKKKYTSELREASKYLIGNLPKHYRKGKRILGFSPNDINPKFKKYLFGRLKDATDISEATNWIKAMELDPCRWEELADLVQGFICLEETGKTVKQVVSKFKSQEIASSPALEVLRKMRANQ